MAPKKSSLRARASSILRSPLATIRQGQLHDPNEEKPFSNISDSSTKASFNEKQNGLEQTRSASSGINTHHTSEGDTFAHDREAQRNVRTIPAWVHVIHSQDLELASRSQRLLSPAEAYLAQHNNSPSGKRTSSRSQENLRDDDRVHATPADTSSRWRAFVTATAYPSPYTDKGKIVSEEWLRQNGPDYDQPWLAGREEGDEENGTAALFKSKTKRRAWYLRMQRTILRSPVVPMVIRMIVFGFSVIALGLACSIHHITDLSDNVATSNPSTDMAIVVDAVALVYLLYITYDEYSGKPLGLRPATAKMRLILLDLFFIVFDSANLSLAFEAIRNDVCKGNTENEQCTATQTQLFHAVLMRQRALASVLLMALIAWLLTFGISVARFVGVSFMPAISPGLALIANLPLG
ncbi:MAG: hypothetical protein Q9163_000978 [Psora crenata]